MTEQVPFETQSSRPLSVTSPVTIEMCTTKSENNRNAMKVLIDNGHGVETEGKRSPDGRLREYAYTREIADRVMNRLQTEGIESIRIIPEETDVELKELSLIHI